MPLNGSHGTQVLDNVYLHRQMGLRGINASELAQASGLTQATLSRISRGHAGVRPSTMAKIAKGLSKYPVLEGVEPLLVAPQAEDKMVGGTHNDQPAGVPVRKPRRKLRPLWPDEGVPPEFVNGLRVIEERPKKTAAPSPTSP